MVLGLSKTILQTFVISHLKNNLPLLFQRYHEGRQLNRAAKEKAKTKLCKLSRSCSAYLHLGDYTGSNQPQPWPSWQEKGFLTQTMKYVNQGRGTEVLGKPKEGVQGISDIGPGHEHRGPERAPKDTPA